MRLSEDQEVIQTLFSYGAYPSFGDGIGIGCPERSLNDVDAFGLEYGIEHRGEFTVTISNQKAKRRFLFRPVPGTLPGLLGNPLLNGRGRDAGQVDPTRTQFNPLARLELDDRL